MIVADTNLVAYLYFKLAYGQEANSVHEIDNIWYCPILWQSEFLNVVSLYIRQGLITFSDGLEAVEFAKRIINRRELPVSPIDVLNLTTKSKCSSYDCEFVALAMDLDTRLVTYDKQILAAFPNIAISATDFIKQSQ